MSDMSQKGESTSRCCFGVICFFVLGIGLAVGIVVGKYVLCSEGASEPPTVQPQVGGDTDNGYLVRMMKNINPENIKENLRNLSSSPHLAGSVRNNELADMLFIYWDKLGMDKVTKKTYDVLLSFPDEDSPNQVFLLDEEGTVEEESPRVEEVYTPEENNTRVVPPFLAYAKSGSVQGQVVYVNYGRVEDYENLTTLEINVTGHIVIARYGKIYRGDKVMIAEKHGAVGMILYSDPEDYRPLGESSVYPDAWWLPPTGTQRGTIFEGIDDPLTPGYPATEFAYRIKEDDTDPKLPGIPVHVIGYGFAEKILGQLDGVVAPDEWRGSLNISYRLGPSLRNNGSVRLNVTTKNERRKITDVIGIIKGSVEPDRYVLLGNHRDAWVFGAIDPSSGTAVMMELSRVVMEIINKGDWRPRRTIIFCSWDAEEYGLIGSTEFVQEYTKNLLNRAVAYVNVDIAVQGNYSIRIKGAPLLYDTSIHATKQVTSPEDATKTVYEEWKTRQERVSINGSRLGIPKYSLPGSGSDYANFLLITGVPVVDLRYTYDYDKWNIDDYPLVHSEYETFYAVEKFVDPDFKYHKTLGQVWLSMVYYLSESVILPLNVSYYAVTLQSLKDQLVLDYGDVLVQNLPDYETNLTTVIKDFTDAAEEFVSRQQLMSKSDVLSIRKYNDQLLQLERAFLDTNGIPGRPYFKHILFAPSGVNSYAGSSFPGLTDLLYELNRSKSPEKTWEEVRKHFSVILLTIQSATTTLKEAWAFI